LLFHVSLAFLLLVDIPVDVLDEVPAAGEGECGGHYTDETAHHACLDAVAYQDEDRVISFSEEAPPGKEEENMGANEVADEERTPPPVVIARVESPVGLNCGDLPSDEAHDEEGQTEVPEHEVVVVPPYRSDDVVNLGDNTEAD